jgi:hypothetical protein
MQPIFETQSLANTSLQELVKEMLLRLVEKPTAEFDLACFSTGWFRYNSRRGGNQG